MALPRRSVLVPACWLAALLAAVARPASPEVAGDISATVVATRGAVPQSQVVPGIETALLALLNETRRQHHLAPLIMNDSLRSIARRHSQEMALAGYIGHGSVGGESFVERLSRVVPAGMLVGENVTSARTTEQAHVHFLASPGHLRNMVHPAFHSVGIGVATAGAAGFIVTEDFAE